MFRTVVLSTLATAALVLLMGAGPVVIDQKVTTPEDKPIPARAPADAEGFTYSYAVKFVCGFQPVNGELSPDGDQYQGEATLKLGNYATDINIFNPGLIEGDVANIRKKIVVLDYKSDNRGREPEYQKADTVDFIELPSCAATMDNCNRLYQLALGFVPPTPPPPMIGFLILQSDKELDVTSVYTSEICSDWVLPPLAGGSFMCSNGNGIWGAGMSIDVETIEGRRLKQ
ncbi:MAG: hypothetical protein K0U98_18150 [Deltaproteobacteria bacterium]|nr:hypothetical protein [Deltaproteobacteria bacterium]